MALAGNMKNKTRLNQRYHKRNETKPMALAGGIHGSRWRNPWLSLETAKKNMLWQRIV